MRPHSTMDVRQLRAFVALVERGRVTTAARALGLAQSSVSEALVALERAVGASLVIRGHGNDKARLTDAGNALLPHARAVLSAIDEAQTAVASATTDARATVDIAANESTSTYLLPSALCRLRDMWPPRLPDQHDVTRLAARYDRPRGAPARAWG